MVKKMKEELGPNAMFTAFEPKQSNRWVVKFPVDFGIESWMVNHVSPVVYDAEKKEWNDITITLYDAIPKSTSKVFSDLIEEGRYHNFLLQMTMLGPIGDEVEDFNFEKCNFKTIDFGHTDYNVKEFKVITLIVSYKKCIVS
jgi:hypothetical protein|tara:strand:+ start:823 stop:1248 length:426 start_codon:yes stop_codon:yes gene_type:complete